MSFVINSHLILLISVWSLMWQLVKFFEVNMIEQCNLCSALRSHFCKRSYSLRPAKSVHFDFFSQTIWSLTKFIMKNMNIYNIK
jgi:hypothetical protein